MATTEIISAKTAAYAAKADNFGNFFVFDLVDLAKTRSFSWAFDKSNDPVF